MTTHEGVSICIPTYNGGRYLREALQSAAAQTYSLFEILVVDHGSSDDTVRIAEEFAATNANVRIVRNTPGGGMVANWERCLTEAQHPWIKFLFQDDLLEPNCLATMVALCRRTSTIAAFCRRDFLIEPDAPADNIDFVKRVHKPEDLFEEGILPTQRLAEAVVKYGTENIIGEPTCLLFHKSLLQKMGSFDARFYQSVDLEFALRAAFAVGLAFAPQPLVKFRVHGGSQTSQNTNVKTSPERVKRSLRSLWGDDILLLNTYLTGEHYCPVRELWTAEELTNKIQYLYLRVCRNYGTAFVHDAFRDMLPYVTVVHDLRYNYLRYKLVKWKYKAYRKKRGE